MFSCHLLLLSSASVRSIPFLFRNGIDLLEPTPKNKDDLRIIGDWNAKVGNQEIPEKTSQFGLGVKNEAGQRLTGFCQENTLVIANILFQQPKRQFYTRTTLDDEYLSQIYYVLCR